MGGKVGVRGNEYVDRERAAAALAVRGAGRPPPPHRRFVHILTSMKHFRAPRTAPAQNLLAAATTPRFPSSFSHCIRHGVVLRQTHVVLRVSLYAVTWKQLIV